ncbi:hypothetical protein [Fulvivirga sp.]|uniref:hypothetical protein n=1 Tax=Fulvivirga sp. TaxID=1931237 RepID=UPI0032EC098B
MKYLTIILTLLSFTSYGQQSQCLDSGLGFTHFKIPVDFEYKVFHNYSKMSAPADLKLVVIPNEHIKYDYSIDGIRLHLINFSDSTIERTVCFKDVTLICQIKKDNGEWHNLEYPIPESFCLNDIQYFDITLNKGDYLKLKAPCYSGEDKVTMKYELTFTDFTIYSDEFEGYTNYSGFN